MHNSAPAVSYPVGRSRFEGHMVLLMVGLTAAVCWTWQAQAGWGWRQGLMASLMLPCGIMAWRHWWRTPAGQLNWDGQAWAWPHADAGSSGRAVVILDLQDKVLVQLPGDRARPTAWVWLEQWRAPADWSALRRALVFGGQNPRVTAPPAAATPERGET